MWVAKGKFTGNEYSPHFKDIYSCQQFIDHNLKKEMDYELELRKIDYAKKHNIDLDSFAMDLISSFWCNSILCYNTKQKRFCDGFDF